MEGGFRAFKELDLPGWSTLEIPLDGRCAGQERAASEGERWAWST
jgi:hypothetical protein